MMSSSIVTAILLTCALLIALLLLIAAASRHKKSAAGALTLIGSTARVETDLQPEGAVIVGGELWRARLREGLTEPLRRGSLARVTAANGHLLEVEPETAVIGEE
jgi:membrane-bound ClpP family serine protease